MKVISDGQLKGLLAKAPAERVTLKQIKKRIAKADFNLYGETMTVCIITLDNGFTTYGESACVNAENFNSEVGQKIAYERAFQKLWALFGFMLAEKNFLAKSGAET